MTPATRLYVVKYGGAEWDAQVDDIVALELSPGDEDAMVNAGRLAVADREYRVVGNQEVYGKLRGETFEAALPQGQEAALVAAGHVQIVQRKTDVPTNAATDEDEDTTTKKKGGK